MRSPFRQYDSSQQQYFQQQQQQRHEFSPSQIILNAGVNVVGEVGSSGGGVTLNRGVDRERGRQEASVALSSNSNMLGFQLDESEVITKGQYYVKYVEGSSASALAGLKEGDKITKINGKSTNGMTYDQFCQEIAIAQQQQQRNNMIHLMVMRRSSKAHGTSSYSLGGINGSSGAGHQASASSATGDPASSASNNNNANATTGSAGSARVLPIKANFYTSTTNTPAASSTNLIDEGYVPGSVTSATSSSSFTPASLGATSSTTYIPLAATSSNTGISIIRVTSPTSNGKTQHNETLLTHPHHSLTL